MSQHSPVGVGINFHRAIEDEIVRHLDALDLVEIISDNLFPVGGVTPALEHVMRTKPIVLHGVNMSLGGAHPLDGAYVERLSQEVAERQPLWFSDHLAMSRLPTLDIGHLMPMRRSRANLELTVQKIAQVQAAIPCRFLVENITSYFEYPNQEMGESEFIYEVLDRTGCGLLLDINNLHINSRNFGFDPFQRLEQLPLDRVVEVHLAGGFTRDGLVIDSHGHSIAAPVWRLLERVCQAGAPRAVIIERDSNFDMPEVLESVARAREILRAPAPVTAA